MGVKSLIRDATINYKINKYIKNGMRIGQKCEFIRPVFTIGEPYLVEIGNNVLISFGVSLLTHDAGTHAIPKLKEYEKIIKFGKIEIGDNCFIGCRSVIMPNVKIGSNCIVGAGSVVTKSFPDNCVIAGSPAKIITSLDEYSKKCLAQTPDYNVSNFKINKQQEVLKHYNTVTK